MEKGITNSQNTFFLAFLLIMRQRAEGGLNERTQSNINKKKIAK